MYDFLSRVNKMFPCNKSGWGRQGTAITHLNGNSSLDILLDNKYNTKAFGTCVSIGSGTQLSVELVSEYKKHIKKPKR